MFNFTSGQLFVLGCGTSAMITISLVGAAIYSVL